MGKYLIAGPPGSGKSSVIRELKSRGFSAYDTDSHPGATRLQDKNGNNVPWPSGTIDWEKYEWNWQSDVINKLLISSPDVFLGGITTRNKEMYRLFDKIFVISINDEIQTQRLLGRKNKDYGKHPDQLAGELIYRPKLYAEFARLDNSSQIDGTLSITEITDKILEETGLIS